MKKKLRDERKWWIDKMKVINRNILTKKQNEIILLRLDGKSFSEIGKITNRTRQNVFNHLLSAKKRINKKIMVD